MSRRTLQPKLLRKAPSLSRRLNLTRLELRETPAVFTVTNLNDSGAGSLREAITKANAAADVDEIVFEPGLVGTIELSTATSGINALVISNPVTIDGGGVITLKNVTPGNRIFRIDNTTTNIAVTLKGLTLTGGNVATAGPATDNGGAISVSNESLTLDNCVIIDNSAARSGGGVAMGTSGQLTVINSTVSGNFAGKDGGGIYFYSGGRLSVTGSTVTGNISSGPRGGGGIYFFGTVTNVAGDQTIKISDTAVFDNQANSTNGGGIQVRSFTGTLLVQNSTVTGNTATGQGGGVFQYSGGGKVWIQNSTIVNNSALALNAGGVGQNSATGILAIESSVVTANFAPAGADVFSKVDVTITDSAITDRGGFKLTPASGNNLGYAASLFLGTVPTKNPGDPTANIVPDSGSPLRNRGSNPAGLATDQLGKARSIDGAVDIGAVETGDPLGLPTAGSPVPDLTDFKSPNYNLVVTYLDTDAINPATFGNSDLSVTGPVAVSVTKGTVTPVAGGFRVEYKLAPTGFPAWDFTQNGEYTVNINAGEVTDIGGNAVKAGTLGKFLVALPQTFFVTNTNDGGPGSLRQAIQDATDLTTTPYDIIEFKLDFAGSKDQTINLSSELVIDTSMTINGPESSVGTVTLSGQDFTRIFRIQNASANLDVHLSRMTLTKGRMFGTGDVFFRGGAIHINGDLAPDTVTLNSVVVSSSQADDDAGGIYNKASKLVINNSRIINNASLDVVFGDGGGLSIPSGNVTLRDSVVSGNFSPDDGGGIYIAGGSLLVENSTISGNSAVGKNSDGGGIFMAFGPTVTVRNSTIANNIVPGNGDAGAVGSGGGITVFGGFTGTLTIQNSTIVGNEALSTGGGISRGGGGTVTVTSSIISGNKAGTGPDVGGIVTANHSAITNTEGAQISGTNNLPAFADLFLGPLQNNGGPTPTIVPLPGSPVRNRGSNPAGLTTDQRGEARVQGSAIDIGAVESGSSVPNAVATTLETVLPSSKGKSSYQFKVTFSDEAAMDATTFDNADVTVTAPDAKILPATKVGVDAPGDGSVRVVTYEIVPPGGFWDADDIGFYTVNLLADAVKNTGGAAVPAGVLGKFFAFTGGFVVTNNLDDGSTGSLRSILSAANQSPGPDTITFDPVFFNVPRTIVLNDASGFGELKITDDLVLEGPGRDLLTVSGGDKVRVFSLDDGTSSQRLVTLSGMTITGGKLSGTAASTNFATRGAGIFNNGENLTINNVVMTKNYSDDDGAAIAMNSPFSPQGKLTILNSVLSDNETKTAGNTDGGAIYTSNSNGQVITIDRSTISGNVARGAGGAIYTVNAVLNITNSTISNNKALSREGGGLWIWGGQMKANITNTTISGNESARSGGGIWINSSFNTLNLRNSTVVFNKAAGTAAGNGGGGIHFNSIASGTTITLASSIIAKNVHAITSPVANDVAGTTSFTLNNSILGDSSGAGPFVPNNSLVGDSFTPVDPMIDPVLKVNGGSIPVATHALMPGSPAIDAGSNPGAVTIDQRGLARTFDDPSVPNGPGSDGTDMGAFELQPAAPPTAKGSIGLGGVQRSRVGFLTVTFSEPVNLPATPAGAFVLTRTGPSTGPGGGPTGVISLAVDTSGSTGTATIAKLTPTDAAFFKFASLIDGNYSLTVLGSQVKSQATGLELDGDGDGTPGGNFVFAPTGTGGLHRFFGDADGNRTVDFNDFLLFRSTFGAKLGEPSYNPAFDADNNNQVDFTDFLEFRTRFGQTLGT